MFELLFGTVPFVAMNAKDLFAKKLKEDLPALADLNVDVPEKLYDLIRKMTEREPGSRISDYSDLIRQMEDVRRNLHEAVPKEEPVQVAGLIHGALYDRPFPEVLGEISRTRLSGKLTISWIDLYKTLHFHKGNLIAVLSNQEGERFSDLVLRHIRISGKLTRKWERQSDLFTGYSTAIREISPDVRLKLANDVESTAWTILRSLFGWIVGEFVFEHGEFPGQFTLRLDTNDVLSRGVREWLDLASIYRRLLDGACRIELAPDFLSALNSVNLAPSDRFLLFRFESSIHFSDLLILSGVAREEFFRLLYLFLCHGIIRVIPDHMLEASRSPEIVPFAEQPAGAIVTPSPEKIGLYYLECAIRSYRDKNYQACAEYCKKAIVNRPNDPRPCHLLGKALAAHPKLHHEARVVLERALTLDPQNVAIELDIGELDFATGNYRSARPRYERILKQDPNHLQALERLKEIARRQR